MQVLVRGTVYGRPAHLVVPLADGSCDRDSARPAKPVPMVEMGKARKSLPINPAAANRSSVTDELPHVDDEALGHRH